MVRLPVQPEVPRDNLPGDLSGGRPATPHDTPQVTPQVRRVLEACQQPSTRRELQSALKLLDRVHFQEKYLIPAISAGFLEMTNPDKPLSKLQKYRVTPIGLAFLKAHKEPAKPESQPESQPESGIKARVRALLANDTLSKREISQRLGQKEISRALNDAIRELRAAGLIEQTIPEKPNSRLQRYRLVQSQRKRSK
jgi:Fic/DOC family protein